MVLKKRYSFFITETQAEALKRIKNEEGTTESEQIRQAINEYLRKKKAVERADLARASKRKRA